MVPFAWFISISYNKLSKRQCECECESHQIILFDMVVYYSVGPCKQSIRSMKFTSQMHSFSSIFCTFQFRTLPSRKRTDECYQLNINCHCYCVDFYLFIFICVPIARTTQFTIYQAHTILLLFMWKFKWIKIPNWFQQRKKKLLQFIGIRFV